MLVLAPSHVILVPDNDSFSTDLLASIPSFNINRPVSLNLLLEMLSSFKLLVQGCNNGIKIDLEYRKKLNNSPTWLINGGYHRGLDY